MKIHMAGHLIPLYNPTTPILSFPQYRFRERAQVWGKTRERQVADITAIIGATRPLVHVRSVRRKGSITIESNPSTHGGRGALPSEGGSPSDLLFLAGGGLIFFTLLVD
ncbi:hypothetical protein E3N88_35101 [Mikania micrantha]|uniref:Uncharacterized protein n=1 Tax=Mikania micrantha TaxID=192012 RepID=A0A5N6M0A5_9ASTR|nr:hypothetical protein E3N88_35101 [Mikania micrantha]